MPEEVGIPTNGEPDANRPKTGEPAVLREPLLEALAMMHAINKVKPATNSALQALYGNLKNHYRKIGNLNHLISVASWDNEVYMPDQGSDARGDAMAFGYGLAHEWKCDPKVGEWLRELSSELELSESMKQRDMSDAPLSRNDVADIREMEREYRANTVLSKEFVEKKAKVGNDCEHAWREQRKNNDWTGFEKNFSQVVQLVKEEAEIRYQKANDKVSDKYDTLLDICEPGMTSKELDRIFGEMKEWLPNLIEKVCAKQAKEREGVVKSLAELDIEFPEVLQKELAEEIMKDIFKFDFTKGRLDTSMHPFCLAVGTTDVRLTTRWDTKDFWVSGLLGVIHETGHALYDQNLPSEFRDLPGGQARSMGVHESQSLFMEMQIARGLPFLELITPLIRKKFLKDERMKFPKAGDREKLDKFLNAENLYKIATNVERSLIRTDADEITYPAHILIRYEIEKKLIDGEIQAEQVPDIWRKLYKEYLGVEMEPGKEYENGCMQDSHWCDVGGWAYFPTYSLGAMYAAQFMACYRRENGGDEKVDEMIRKGELGGIFCWLKEKVWGKGSLRSVDEILREATGEGLNVDYYRRHLEGRYL